MWVEVVEAEMESKGVHKKRSVVIPHRSFVTFNWSKDNNKTSIRSNPEWIICFLLIWGK